MLCQDPDVSTNFDIFVMTEFIVKIFAAKRMVKMGDRTHPLPLTASNLIKQTQQ